MLLKIFIKSTRNSRTPNCSNEPSQPNSQILFHKDRTPQDFVKRLWNQGTPLQQYCTVYYYVLRNERKKNMLFLVALKLYTPHMSLRVLHSTGLEFEFQVGDTNRVPIKY